MILGPRHSLEMERRREAVLVGRRGIGRKLEIMLEGVVQAPLPSGWLELLQAADERAASSERRTGSRGN